MSKDIPHLMKAIVLTEDGGTPFVKEIPVPKPGPGEVLVKMHASPINPSDLAFLAGGYGIKKEYPAVPGFEGSGTVVAAGKGFLPKMSLGKIVACAASKEYDGCWAEYMITKAGMCVPLSKNITPDQASMMFVNPMTALAFFDLLKKRPNSTHKPQGIINTAAASALGRMVIRMGKTKNIPVVSVVRREEQLEQLKAEGAEYVLNSTETNFEEKLKVLAHELNVNTIFDAVGGKLVQQLLDAVPPGSKLYIYGRLSDETCEISERDLIFSGNQIQGFWLSGWLKQKSLWQSLRITKKIKALLGKELGTKIHKHFEAENITEAIETYKNNMSKGKVLIRF